jgi:sugar O-acyltransferase (sialic acid O-acetyltransferase NeuD family)
MSGLLIIGAGGHGLVVADAAQETGRWSEIAFLDEARGRAAHGGWPIVGSLAEIDNLHGQFPELVVAIGNNEMRLNLAEDLIRRGRTLPVIVHPRAYVSSSAVIGDGTVVLAQCAVSPAVTLGRACIINTGASVDHDCVLEDGVHISPGARLAGGVRIGRCAWIGIGSSVRDGVSIGRSTILGAGAAVIHDLPDHCTAVGVPARALDRGTA